MVKPDYAAVTAVHQKPLFDAPQHAVKPKHVLSSTDLTADEIRLVLDTAKLQKALRSKGGATIEPVENRLLAMIFEKQSLRTRVSFETAAFELGGHGVYLTKNDIEMGKRESIADTARVLSNWCSMIVARLYKQEDIEELAAWSSVPVINALTDAEHPCQALADLLTLEEVFGSQKLKLVWIGDGNNVANSFAVTAARLGHDVVVCTPAGYEATDHVYGFPNVTASYSPAEAVVGAHAVITDVWVSMGQEEETETRMRRFAKFQVNEELLGLADPSAVFLHCLPAVRGLEVTDGVIDGDRSVVFQQSDNRLHAQKALMSLIFDGVLA
ncbi:MAG: ornithine carbamoyltransferase [Armatimonadetes bacterium]|nr:ornithine carbamoyltransferase [Armatimonadota bacterium]